MTRQSKNQFIYVYVKKTIAAMLFWKYIFDYKEQVEDQSKNSNTQPKNEGRKV
jgi:hypothetical protein